MKANIFGKANAVLPDFIRLCQQLSANFPKRNPHSFALIEVNQLPQDSQEEKQLLFYDGLLHPNFLKYSRKAYPIDCVPSKVFTLQISFTQLCCLYDKGKPVLLPSFSFLIKRLWERAWLLNSFYGDGYYPKEQVNWRELFQKEPSALPEALELKYWQKKKTQEP